MSTTGVPGGSGTGRKTDRSIPDPAISSMERSPPIPHASSRRRSSAFWTTRTWGPALVA